MEDYLLLYIVMIAVILGIKIIFWIVYWTYVRPSRLRQRLERQEIARVLLIQQQRAIQHQRQQQFNQGYPPVQSFDYSSVYPVPVNPVMDLPPSYEKAVENSNPHPGEYQQPKF